ncbi:MAG: hypothetical protein ACHQNT_08455 [Bacteroidia bacterium]
MKKNIHLQPSKPKTQNPMEEQTLSPFYSEVYALPNVIRYEVSENLFTPEPNLDKFVTEMENENNENLNNNNSSIK